MRRTIPFPQSLSLAFVTVALAAAVILHAPAALAQSGTTIPLTENRGQVVDTRGERRPDILYTGSTPGMRIFFRRDGISYVFVRWTPDSARARSDAPAASIGARVVPSGTLRLCRVDMNLIGANPRATADGGDSTGAYSNYYRPGEPGGITNVPSFGSITYRDIYPHIDLVVHSAEGHLKYDFVVHPGGNPGDIRWSYGGNERSAIGAGGALHVSGALGDLEEQRPYAYQKFGGFARNAVACRYTRSGETYGYRSAAYDRAADLVIDPTVQWATYCGGLETEMASGSHGSVTADPSGNVCAIGATLSVDFPVSSGAMQTSNAGASDMFILKLTANGALVWSTYWGGSGDDIGTAIAIDRNGRFAVAGSSTSIDFPITGGAIQPANAGGGDLIVGQLDAAGKRVWATYFGGTDADYPNAVAVDPIGSIVVVGQTASDNYTLKTPIQNLYAQQVDGFITKLSSSGALLWSTYYGGSGADAVEGVATNFLGDIAVTGNTSSVDLPLFGTTFSNRLHGTILGDAFLMVITADARGEWATYYGGAIGSWGYAVAYDTAGAIVMAGGSFSPDLPTKAGAMQQSPKGSAEECYITKFTSYGVHRWCTYYGGSGADAAQGIAIGPKNDIFIAGSTGSLNLPLPAATYQQALRGPNDAFVLQMDSGGTKRKWATYYGGSNTDDSYSAVFAAGALYVMGSALSNDLTETPKGFQQTAGGNGDAFVAKFNDFCSGPKPAISASAPLVLCEGDSVTLTASPGFTNYQWAPDDQRSPSIVVKTSGSFSVTAEGSDGCMLTSDPTVVLVSPKPAAVITPAGPLTICNGDSILLSAKRGGIVSYKWSNNATSDGIWVKDSGTYTVRVIDTNGCTGTSAPVAVTFQPRAPRPVLAPADTVWLCPDSVLTLDAGSGYDTYRWSPTGDVGRTVRADRSGLYYVDVTAPNTCSVRSDSVVVIVNPRIHVAVVASGAVDFCSGDSVTLRLSPGAFTAPVWSTGDSAIDLVVRTSGIYWAAVTDSNGCRVRTDSVRVNVRPSVKADIIGASSICVGSAGIYTTSATGTVRYTWTVSGGGAIQGASDTKSVRVQWSTAGPARLTLQVVDTVGGCSATNGLDVSVGTSLKPAVSPGGTLTLCAGDSVELDAGAGYASYQWTTGETVEKIMVRQPGSYGVTVVDSTGCGGASDPVIVNRGQVALTIVPAGPLRLRAGDSVTLDAGAGYASYRWRLNGADAGSARTLRARDSGSYDVTVVDTNGCNGSAAVRIDPAGAATAELAIADVTGVPGTHVEIPIMLLTSDNLDVSGATAYEARVRYRTSMLVPAGTTPFGALDGVDRVLTLSGALPAGMTKGELGRFDFIAALGDSQSIVMRLENVTWRGAGGGEMAIVNTLHGGTFTLTGLCPNGGTRLVSTGGVGLKSIVPNPASDEVTIGYELLESGPSRLSITDALGRERAVLADADMPPGTYSAVLDARSLESGTFVVVLRTASGVASGIVQVVRGER